MPIWFQLYDIAIEFAVYEVLRAKPNVWQCMQCVQQADVYNVLVDAAIVATAIQGQNRMYVCMWGSRFSKYTQPSALMD